ncbi:hypothetical protein [Flavobacterium granuli]|uniref:Uncharacterized protein n=1 Tax=Flavobacterium granuli TaxID=280093 RepID=A0ABU1S5W3_9FLAO|nr:hypothetical protein [Flavobacterium granuli]MDR6846431.1 hypothetical protein [Flavobacterium granuli]
MIQTISIWTSSGNSDVSFDKIQKNKTEIDVSKFLTPQINSFDIVIRFSQPISEFRDHDYNWVKCNRDRIANEFCPKIIKLKDGTLVQANRNIGIWEINKKNKSILLWRFNPEYASPLTNYIAPNNERTIDFAKQRFLFIQCLALLFPAKNAIEFSRSKIPFTAIACFTDHCDFDTLENLKIQRDFFKRNNVKITKGFFLNHFSKRTDNASFEYDAVELEQWKEDGHELCYHSLSQSIKSGSGSNADFFNFVPPNSDMPTWIDHGYQPYNLSLFKNKKIETEVYENNLISKNIKILWNYVDSGTATFGVINQLNSQHFTLYDFLTGNKDLGFSKKMQLMIKNIVFHFYGDQKLLLKYKSIAGNFKKVFYQKDKSKFYLLLKDSFSIFFNIINVLLFWNSNRNKPYKLAKYNPILFKHTIFEKEFYIFQTLEMVDFKKALCPDNIELLIKEKGIFIAHTYFSVPMEYHNGKLFDTVSTIDKEVANNFSVLGTKIMNNEIWNPTLKELVGYWSGFENILLDIDELGVIAVKNETDLIFRVIK